jgi:hypothetical protein
MGIVAHPVSFWIGSKISIAAVESATHREYFQFDGKTLDVLREPYALWSLSDGTFEVRLTGGRWFIFRPT